MSRESTHLRGTAPPPTLHPPLLPPPPRSYSSLCDGKIIPGLNDSVCCKLLFGKRRIISPAVLSSVDYPLVTPRGSAHLSL